MKNQHDKNRVVYSTNPDLNKAEESREEESISATQQTLYVSLERNKGGKVATIIDNFKGKDAELNELGKLLKTKCGTGGTVKDGIILVQGEKREQVITILNTLGYKTKRKGG
ncbi:MAG: translation initiation factor [Bacteroidetes bacterium]|nr:translation initiation factor [Bacteroidota bacterium]